MMRLLYVLIHLTITCLSLVSTKPKPLVNFPWFSTLKQQWTGITNTTIKDYSGLRVTNDSLIMIYYHDDTVAVTELGPKKLLLGCELIEIVEESQGNELLQKLTIYNKPLKISFTEMIKLMRQCELVDMMTAKNKQTAENPRTDSLNIFPRNPASIFSGIIPGTKWCGTGDIATSYHDLGIEEHVDRCCRQHDLCPVKLRRNQQKYNIQNDSLYTKSHCLCDDIFYSCLKRTNTSASNLMGTVYFNLVALPCVQQINNNYQFRGSKRDF